MFNILDLASYVQMASVVLQEPIMANAQITLHLIRTVPTGTDDLGNPLSVDETFQVVLDCYLRPESPPQSDLALGLSHDWGYFIGRLIKPKTYNFPIQLNPQDFVIINEKKANIKLIRTVETAVSLQVGLPDNLGQRLYLYATYL